MDALLEPPVDFRVALPEVEDSGPWFRVHGARYGAVYFNQAGTHRFNAPEGEYGVMYMSASSAGALAETLLAGRSRPPFVDEVDLRLRALSQVSFARPLRLADFAETGLARLGLDGRIAAADCYELARRWSRWVHDHPQCVDGIVYRARNAPAERSVALFEREDLEAQSHVLEGSLCPAPGALSAATVTFVEAFQVALLSS